MFWSCGGEGAGYGCGTSFLPCLNGVGGGAPGRGEGGVVRTGGSGGLSSPHKVRVFSGCCRSSDCCLTGVGVVESQFVVRGGPVILACFW